MSDDAEDKVIEMNPKLSAREWLDQLGAAPREPAVAPASAASAEGDDPLPAPGDPYKAHSRPSLKPEPMLGLLTRSVPFEAFAYGDLRRVRLAPPGALAGAPVLVLRFGAHEVTEVVIEGRNLLPLAHYIRQQRLAWVRECPAGRDPDDPASVRVTRITVKEPEGE